MVALPGQQNHRQAVVERLRFPQQFKPRPAAQAIVQQTDVVHLTPEGGQGVIVIVHPLQLITMIPDFRNQIASDDIIILIVIHQQDSDAGVRHTRDYSWSLGNSTTSNQYCPSTLINSTRDLNVTGLVT